jgi:hypothetical protein
MGDYICKYCQDRTCAMCGDWCWKKGRYVYICCDHKSCHKKNKTHEFRERR